LQSCITWTDTSYENNWTWIWILETWSNLK
jgi:hypothetical protein